MQSRINIFKVAPNAIQSLKGIGEYDSNISLEESLLDLMLVRASQINRCAQCLDMHIKDARASGETEQRLYALVAWRETPFYTERERAALEWTEKLTLISTNDVPDELYNSLRQHFSEQELVNLTLAINTINNWNRLAISFRTEPGSYIRK